MSTAANVALGAICVVIVVAGLRLVTTDNIVHAALALMIVLAGTAAVFMLFGAEFLGWTQVLVYIGAIVVLFMFGVMLTKAKLGEADDIDAPRAQRLVALAGAVLIFALLTIVFVNVYGDSDLEVLDQSDASAQVTNEEGVLAHPTTSAEIGEDLFERWVLPFEAVSVVLLAALIGAVVLARRDDPDHVLERSGGFGGRAGPSTHEPPNGKPAAPRANEEMQ